MKQKQLLFVVLLLVAIQTKAQKAWTLEECVGYAVAHNLQLNDLDLNTQSNKERYRQSVRNLMPTVSGFANYFIRYGRQVNPEDNSIVNTDIFSNNYSIDASFDVFQGFQKINSIKAAKNLYRATQEESLQEKYLLAFRVMSAYYDIQFIEGLIHIAKEQIDISTTNYTLVKRQVELGVMAGADLYEAESLLLTDSLSLTQNNNRLKAAKLALIQAMNLEDEVDINIVPAPLATSTATAAAPLTDAVFEKAKGFIPTIKAQEYRLKAAQKQVAVSRGALYPSLAVGGGIGTGYFETIRDTLGNTIPFRDQFKDNRFEYVGANLNVPIFSAWANRSRIKQQKIALERAKNDAKIAEQELFKTIQQLVQEQEALLVETQQTAKGQTAQKLAFDIAQKRYEKGMINAIALGQAKNLFATAQNQNLQAQLRLLVNKSTLDFYRGLPVFNIN